MVLKYITLISLMLVTCKASTIAQAFGKFVDSRDGKEYKTVKIGRQEWMAENLAYQLPKGFASYNEEGNDAVVQNKHGYYYRFREACKACPDGWRLPSKLDWDTLMDKLGGEAFAGKRMKSKIGWSAGGNGTNESGFNALPSGEIKVGLPYFSNYRGERVTWWSSTIQNVSDRFGSEAWIYSLIFSSDLFTRSLANISNNVLYSVRCIKGDIPKRVYYQQQDNFVDTRDGKTYEVVKIGNQVWMAQNLAYAPQNGQFWSYNNDANVSKTLGYLYDFETAQKVCPIGWHLPNEAEWSDLTKFVDGDDLLLETCDKLKSKSELWGIYKGSNLSGFNALPSGYGVGTPNPQNAKISFSGLGTVGTWWTSTVTSNMSLESRYTPNLKGLYLKKVKSFLIKDSKYVGSFTDRGAGNGNSNDYAFLPVRCLKD